MAYANIRELLALYIGKTLLDVTQHDQEDFDCKTQTGCFVELMFADGYTLRFPADSGFIQGHPDECPCGVCGDDE